MMRIRKHGNRASRGFTLIEILVALVVLSIGLLGIAALQLLSLRANHASALRSQATYLAYDIVDRMRANRADAIAGRYDIAMGTPGTSGTVYGNDHVAWKTNIARTLPAYDDSGTMRDADGSVSRNGNVFTVRIRWSDWDDTGTNSKATIEFSMDTQLTQ